MACCYPLHPAPCTEQVAKARPVGAPHWRTARSRPVLLMLLLSVCRSRRIALQFSDMRSDRPPGSTCPLRKLPAGGLTCEGNRSRAAKSTCSLRLLGCRTSVAGRSLPRPTVASEGTKPPLTASQRTHCSSANFSPSSAPMLARISSSSVFTLSIARMNQSDVGRSRSTSYFKCVLPSKLVTLSSPTEVH